MQLFLDTSGRFRAIKKIKCRLFQRGFFPLILMAFKERNFDYFLSIVSNGNRAEGLGRGTDVPCAVGWDRDPNSGQRV